MATEDAAVLLADFVSSLDNLPSEVHHILQEIGHKEAKSHDFLHRGTSRDQAIQKFGRPQSQGGMGLIAVNPKEEASIAKIRMEFSRAEDLARDKVALSERGVALLARHLTRLTAQLESLTPNVPPLPTLPTYAPAPVAPTPAAPYNQSYSTPQPAQQQQQYHSASYQAGAYGMGTGSTNMGAPGSQGAHAYGTSIDKNGQYTGHHQQQQQNGQHAHQNGYPYSSPASQSGSAARGARPSRLATVYPIPQGNGQHSPHNANQLAQQQHQHLQAQQIQLQQQQQQQMLRQQQQQQLLQQQQQQQHNHHQAHSSGTKQRRRNTEGEAEEEADEGEADGEDQTPYCFCQRPSFGEMIGCDAPDCAIEWFHLSCVGLKSTPEGSWYCTSCEPKISKLGPGGGRGGRRK